jgi:SAM-dependent methyltransferase
MSFYENKILPHLLNLAMQQKDLAAYRQRVVPAAHGRVLEIGIGSGLNLPFYTAAVDQVIGLDPSLPLLEMARRHARDGGVPVALLQASAEAIPLDDASVDTVLTTWTLCSIPDVRAALAEMRRVLKPGGSFLFVEHGRAPEQGVARWQNRLTPVWRPISGGCHLNRPINTLIQNSDPERRPCNPGSRHALHARPADRHFHVRGPGNALMAEPRRKHRSADTPPTAHAPRRRNWRRPASAE